jgi:hypothetical protein
MINFWTIYFCNLGHEYLKAWFTINSDILIIFFLIFVLQNTSKARILILKAHGVVLMKNVKVMWIQNSFIQWEKVFGQWYNIYISPHFQILFSIEHYRWQGIFCAGISTHNIEQGVRGVNYVVNVCSFATLSKVFCHWLSETLF